MSRFARPEELGPYLDSHAQTWERILEGADTAALSVFGRVEALARSWARVHRDVLEPYGINYAELSTLAMLRTSDQGSCFPSDLRSLVGQSSAGMTRILDKLERRGLVRRAAPASDGRRVEVRLSERGVALTDECFGALLGVQTSLLEGIAKRRLDALVLGIDALLTACADRSEREAAK